jgi:hypothetical protein
MLHDFLNSRGLNATDFKIAHAAGGRIDATFRVSGRMVKVHIVPPALGETEVFRGQVWPLGRVAVQVGEGEPVIGPIDETTWGRIAEAMRAPADADDAAVARSMASEKLLIDPADQVAPSADIELAELLEGVAAKDADLAAKIIDKLKRIAGAPLLKALGCDAPAEASVDDASKADAPPDPPPPPRWDERGYRIYNDAFQRPKSAFPRQERPRPSIWAE